MFLGFAKLARVYGWTDSEIRQLTLSRFKAYLVQADVSIAEESLFALRVADWPRMKAADRSKVWHSYQKLVNPNYEEDRQQANRLLFDRFELARKESKRKHNAQKGNH